MILKQLNPHACKTYLIKENDKDEIILIDPVIDHVKDYLKLLHENNYKLKYVIDTHTHADHISGAAVLMDYTDCDYIMHINVPAQCSGYKVKEGDSIQFDNIKIKVIETPGHTKDSISLITDDNIFTGDALFLDDGGAGRDDLPGGDPGQHWESLQKFMNLPDDLIVYPAHDYRNRKPSSLAIQKKNNPHLKPRSKEEYIKYLEDLKLGPAEWMKDVLKANYACARDPKAAWIPVDMPACEVKGTLDIGVNEQEVETITPCQVKNIIDNNIDYLLLDVREPHELAGELGHIHGIKNIPIDSLISELNNLEEYKNKEIITICRSGHRAYTSAQILKQAGFTNVRVMKGGMIAWRNEECPAENS